MSQGTIVLCFPVEPDHVAQISDAATAHGLEVVESTQDTIAADILQADIFCGHAKKNPIDWRRVVDLDRLKWIQSSAAGLDHCLDQAVVDSKIIVSGCSGLFANQVAEQTLALLFGMLRRLPDFFRAQQEKQYLRRPTDEISGKTIGIVGFGGNGQRIAEVLRPLGCRVVATDLFAEQITFDGAEVLPHDRLFDLASRCDIVIATLPLIDSTRHLLGADFFEALKPGGYFVNVGRGSTVDQAVLVQHLRNGRLQGAALDVADPEPLPPESPLWEMDNVIITPHVGAQSKSRVPCTVQLFLENLERYHAGQSLINLVDKQLGFPRPENRWDRRSLS